MVPFRSLDRKALRLPWIAIAGDQRAMYSRALSYVLFGAVPALLTVEFIYICFHAGSHLQAVDFHDEFWPAARRILDGLSPYDRGWQDVNVGLAFPYPPLTGLAFVPFALIPRTLADVAFTAMTFAALPLTLRVLDLRDWRIYGLVLVWPPVCTAWQSANLTLLFALGIAYLWRKRNHPAVAGVLVATLISLKPFIWPVALWLLATRRYVALGWAALWGVVLNLIAWTVLGFSQLRAYERELHAVTAAMYHRGYTIVDFASHLGWGGLTADALGGGVALAIGLAGFVVGRRGDDRSALTLSLVLALLATPVLWSQYFALMIVPVTLSRPRLGAVWFLPLALWACPTSSPSTWQIALAWLVNATLVAQSLMSAGSIKRSRDVTLGARPMTEPAAAETG